MKDRLLVICEVRTQTNVVLVNSSSSWSRLAFSSIASVIKTVTPPFQAPRQPGRYSNQLADWKRLAPLASGAGPGQVLKLHLGCGACASTNPNTRPHRRKHHYLWIRSMGVLPTLLLSVSRCVAWRSRGKALRNLISRLGRNHGATKVRVRVCVVRAVKLSSNKRLPSRLNLRRSTRACAWNVMSESHDKPTSKMGLSPTSVICEAASIGCQPCGSFLDHPGRFHCNY